jgi:hypothetical protein
MKHMSTSTEISMSHAIYLAMSRQLQNLTLNVYGKNLYYQRFLDGIPASYQTDQSSREGPATTDSPL